MVCKIPVVKGEAMRPNGNHVNLATMLLAIAIAVDGPPDCEERTGQSNEFQTIQRARLAEPSQPGKLAKLSGKKSKDLGYGSLTGSASPLNEKGSTALQGEVSPEPKAERKPFTCEPMGSSWADGPPVCYEK